MFHLLLQTCWIGNDTLVHMGRILEQMINFWKLSCCLIALIEGKCRVYWMPFYCRRKMALDKVKGYAEVLGSRRNLLLTWINALFVGSKDIGKINALVGKGRINQRKLMLCCWRILTMTEEDQGKIWRHTQ